MYQVVEYSSLNCSENDYIVMSEWESEAEANKEADERHDKNEQEVEGTDFFNSKIVTVKAVNND